MSNSNFQNDLKEARAIEVEVAHTLIQKHNHHLITFAPNKNFPDWDFSYKNQTFEVKYDRQAKKTGNIYVEIKCLNNTKADYFIYYIDNAEIYIFETRYLIDNIKTLQHRYVQFAGDNNENEGYLIKLSKIQNFKYSPDS